MLQYLDPDSDAVQRLSQSLLDANMGIVSHYYMDVELQGILHAVQQSSPLLQNRVGTADSLKMGDMAVQMCQKDNVEAIACLGVDFMAESVRAILAKNGYGHIPVYRPTSQVIGCSLAESAEQSSYRAWLQQNAGPNTLHVVYINTSLESKAVSASTVPTITCTSSNVVQTMLQASAQAGPDLRILYGPDTYMGQNLVTLFDTIVQEWDDDRISRELHPQHNRETLRRLRDNFNVFPNGNCVVHHMFGEQVVDTVRRQYDDCYVTAHLEVPGEMFKVGMEKSMEDMGVVGSTADILQFIHRKVEDAASRQGKQPASRTSRAPKLNGVRGYQSNRPDDNRLRFILGTEAGMVTSIVKSVQDILRKHNDTRTEAEIIFPVASEAIMAVDDNDHNDMGMSVVPGVSGGEGCSTAGGCATCPFMKMNDIDRLQDVIDMVTANNADNSHELALQSHQPPNRLAGKQMNGIDAIDLGTEPILYMREFMKTKRLSDDLMDKLRTGQTTTARAARNNNDGSTTETERTEATVAAS